MRRLIVALFAPLVSGLLATVAIAHAFLDQAISPVGATVSTPPKEVRIFFSEAVEPRFSGATLATASGQAIPTGPAKVDPGDAKQLVLLVPSLGPGEYRVMWHVVSVDTHHTEGNFTFTVKP